MLLLKHLKWSLLPSIVLFFFYRWEVWIFVATNVLIDADHYPVYVIKFKNLSLIKAHSYFKNISKCEDLALFHTPEFIIFVLILSFFYKILFLVFLGLVFHVILDVYEFYKDGKGRPFFLMPWLIKYLKNRK